MKIYLTGYTGFIGNSLYQTLSSKYEIIRVNLRKVNFLNNEELNEYYKVMKPWKNTMEQRNYILSYHY